MLPWFTTLRLTALLLPLVLVPAAVVADDDDVGDTVTLTSGRTLSGHIVLELDDLIVLRSSGRDREIDPAEVTQVHSRARGLRQVLDRWQQIDPDNDAALVELAAFARQLGLEPEARLAALAAVLANPHDTTANETLGHTRRKDGWWVAHGRRKYPVEQLETLAEAWKSRWQLETTHYDLHTNLPLSRAIETAFDLEATHAAVRELLARPLRLYEVEARLRVQVHADEDSFPESFHHPDGYLFPEDRTVYVDASSPQQREPAARRALVREATRQLLHEVTVHARRGRGPLPAWLDQGLGEYVAAALGGPPGRARFTFGASPIAAARQHLAEPDPLQLSNLVGLGPLDFVLSTGISLKRAQCVTLTHFGLHGEDGALRPGFLRFVHDALDGRTSSKHLLGSVDRTAEQFIEAWLEHVVVLASG